ncbi:MAG: MotA/TolQ/ExbB proton channel family protein [Flavobacteriales bacterium]
MGNPANFKDGDITKESLNNNFLGVIYKGGPIVILLISFQLIMAVYVIERFIAIWQCLGKGDLVDFIFKIKRRLSDDDLEGIQQDCDAQKGSVANVVKTGLETFLKTRKSDQVDQKDNYLIQKELEEATKLEISMLNMNMFILSTTAQISTLIGLLGTVTGMIKAFAALAQLGEPDAVGLAGGISQALVATALDIGTAAITIVFYNYFSNKVERIIYTIDKASFSILHNLNIKFFDFDARR